MTERPLIRLVLFRIDFAKHSSLPLSLSLPHFFSARIKYTSWKRKLPESVARNRSFPSSVRGPAYSLGKSLLVGLIVDCRSFSSGGGGSRRLGRRDSSSSYRLVVLLGRGLRLHGSGASLCGHGHVNFGLVWLIGLGNLRCSG